MRTFIAIEFPPTVQQQLAGICQGLRSYLQAMHAPNCLRWIPPNNRHLTLRFLGETTPAQMQMVATALRNVVDGRTAFDLTLAGIGGFPTLRQPRLLWLGVGGELPQLHTLQAAIEAAVQAVGCVAEERPFSAHITVARAQHNATKEQLRRLGELVQAYGAAEQIVLCVAEVVHLQSELRSSGAKYRPLQRFRLNA